MSLPAIIMLGGLMPSISTIQNMVRQAFKDRTVSRFEILSGGLINTNLRVQLDSGESVVLRVHRDGAASCRKELALHRLVRETTPVASIIHAEPEGVDGSSAFTILEYVEGITFQELNAHKPTRSNCRSLLLSWKGPRLDRAS